MFQPSTIQRNTTKKQHNWTTIQPIIIQETRHINQSETFKLFTSTNQSPSNSLHQPISHIISQPGFVKSFYHQWRLSCFSQPIEFLAAAVFPPIRRFNSASVKIQSQSDKSSQHFRQHRHTALKFRVSDSPGTMYRNLALQTAHSHWTKSQCVRQPRHTAPKINVLDTRQPRHTVPKVSVLDSPGTLYQKSACYTALAHCTKSQCVRRPRHTVPKVSVLYSPGTNPQN